MNVNAPGCHERVSALFQCLASPVRTRLIEQLLDRSACVHELVDALALPQPLISQHLRVLRSHGLVSCTRRGREVLYQLDDEHVARIVRDALAHAAEIAQTAQAAEGEATTAQDTTASTASTAQGTTGVTAVSAGDPVPDLVGVHVDAGSHHPETP